MKQYLCFFIIHTASYAVEVKYPPIEESLALVASENQDLRSKGMRDLVGMGKQAAPAYDKLYDIALSSNYWPRTRSSAAMALQNIDPVKATTDFIQALTNSTDTIREYAVDALMTIKRPEATMPLFYRLRDENEQVRSRATIALQFYKNTELERALIGTLTDPADKAREKAPWLLGRMHSETALTPLHSLLADDSPEFRKNVIAALRDIQSQSSAPPLIEVVKRDTDDEVRMRAIQCLGELGDMSAAAIIMEALNDDNPEVRAYAAGAIGSLGVEAAKPRLRKILEQGIGRETLAAMSALCQMKDTNSIPIIVKHLDTEDEMVATYMSMGLYELGAEAELKELAIHGTPVVQRIAINQLDKLKKNKDIQHVPPGGRGEAPRP